jgi:hypothetical protein
VTRSQDDHHRRRRTRTEHLEYGRAIFAQGAPHTVDDWNHGDR